MAKRKKTRFSSSTARSPLRLIIIRVIHAVIKRIPMMKTAQAVTVK